MEKYKRRTCEELAVLLLHFLRDLKLLLGMFLRHFIPQKHWILLLPVRGKTDMYKNISYT